MQPRRESSQPCIPIRGSLRATDKTEPRLPKFYRRVTENRVFRAPDWRNASWLLLVSNLAVLLREEARRFGLECPSGLVRGLDENSAEATRTNSGRQNAPRECPD